MAPMPRNVRLRLAMLLLLGPAAVLPAATTPTSLDLHQRIDYEADFYEVDYKKHTMLLKQNVVVSQGTMQVTADQARAFGLGSDNSRWVFEGNVRIKAEPRGNLRSNQAVVEFRDKRIAKATVTGTPAQFEQKRSDSEQIARGHANEIVYDIGQGTVRLTNDAWLSDGQNEISGTLLVYNIREQRVQATSEEPGKRVHVTIEPGSPPPGQNKTPPSTLPPTAPEPPKQP